MSSQLTRVSSSLMLVDMRRLAVAISVAASVLGSFASCAGWQMTAAARIACCADGTCPMHSDDAQAQSGVTQRDADQCCTLSDRPLSDRSRGESSASVSLVAFGLPLPTIAHTPRPPHDASWHRLLARGPFTAPIPTRLLLSVFLI